MPEEKTVATIPARHSIAPQQYPQQFSFDQLMKMAQSFAKSQLYGIRDPDQALSLLLVAQAEGKNPALIMKDYDIIGGRPAKKAEAMMRDYQATGGVIEWVELSDTRAAAHFSHPLAPKPLLMDWDIERAKKAGLVSKTGGMYDKFTRAMLRSRCVSEGIRSTAPQATSGVYTPEEVRAIQQEEVRQPVAIEAAVAQGATVVRELPKEEWETLVATLDVSTRADLVSAFNAGAQVLQERGNLAQFEKFKKWRDDMLSLIEAGQLV